MRHVVDVLGQHGSLILFVSVSLARAGLPIPLVPILMTAGALAGLNPLQLSKVILASTAGSLLGELCLYWLGLRYGPQFLAVLCRMSLSPDFCVRQTETMFTKLGSWAQLFAKFLPGLWPVSVTLAGVTRMSLLAFDLLNGLGGLLFTGLFVVLGAIFRDAITSVLATLTEFGSLAVLAVLAGLGMYLLFK